MNDQRHIEKMLFRRDRDYQAWLDKEEDRRAEAERERLRKLHAQGIITAADMPKDSYLYQQWSKHNKTGKDDNEKTPRNNKDLDKTPTHNNNLNNRAIDAPHRQNTQHRHNNKNDDDNRKNQRSRGRSRERSRDRDGSCERDRSYERDGSRERDNKREDSPDDEEDKKSRLSFYEEEEEKKLAEEQRGKYEHPIIIEMRREETVDGLYRLAEEVVVLSPKKDTASTKKAY